MIIVGVIVYDLKRTYTSSDARRVLALTASGTGELVGKVVSLLWALTDGIVELGIETGIGIVCAVECRTSQIKELSHKTLPNSTVKIKS